MCVERGEKKKKKKELFLFCCFFRYSVKNEMCASEGKLKREIEKKKRSQSHALTNNTHNNVELLSNISLKN